MFRGWPGHSCTSQGGSVDASRVACEFGESGVQVLTQITDPDVLVSLLCCGPQLPEGEAMTEGGEPALPSALLLLSFTDRVCTVSPWTSSKAVLILSLERSYFYPSAFITFINRTFSHFLTISVWCFRGVVSFLMKNFNFGFSFQFHF